jgi:hypothetical protein
VSGDGQARRRPSQWTAQGVAASRRPSRAVRERSGSIDEASTGSRHPENAAVRFEEEEGEGRGGNGVWSASDRLDALAGCCLAVRQAARRCGQRARCAVTEPRCSQRPRRRRPTPGRRSRGLEHASRPSVAQAPSLLAPASIIRSGGQHRGEAGSTFRVRPANVGKRAHLGEAACLFPLRRCASLDKHRHQPRRSPPPRNNLWRPACSPALRGARGPTRRPGCVASSFEPLAALIVRGARIGYSARDPVDLTSRGGCRPSSRLSRCPTQRNLGTLRRGQALAYRKRGSCRLWPAKHGESISETLLD